MSEEERKRKITENKENEQMEIEGEEAKDGKSGQGVRYKTKGYGWGRPLQLYQYMHLKCEGGLEKAEN